MCSLIATARTGDTCAHVRMRDSPRECLVTLKKVHSVHSCCEEDEKPGRRIEREREREIGNGIRPVICETARDLAREIGEHRDLDGFDYLDIE